jgi:hypothetical protein
MVLKEVGSISATTTDELLAKNGSTFGLNVFVRFSVFGIVQITNGIHSKLVNQISSL